MTMMDDQRDTVEEQAQRAYVDEENRAELEAAQAARLRAVSRAIAALSKEIVAVLDGGAPLQDGVGTVEEQVLRGVLLAFEETDAAPAPSALSLHRSFDAVPGCGCDYCTEERER